MYASYGEGWIESKIGLKLAILSICEVVDHPDVKKNGNNKTKGSFHAKSTDCVRTHRTDSVEKNQGHSLRSED